MSLRFDLTQGARENQGRIRRWRYTLLAIGLAPAAGMLFTAALLVIFSGSHAGESSSYIVAAALVFVSILVVFMTSLPFRLMAPPPVGLEVSAEGLSFVLSDGRTRGQSWHAEGEMVILVEKRADPKIPPSSRARLTAAGSSTDRGLPWRSLVPSAYLPGEAVEPALAMTRSEGLEIRSDPWNLPFATRPWTRYVMWDPNPHSPPPPK